MVIDSDILKKEFIYLYNCFRNDTYEYNLIKCDIAINVQYHDIYLDVAYDTLLDFLIMSSSKISKDDPITTLMNRLERWLVIINDKYIEYSIPDIFGIPAKGPSWIYLYDIVVEFLDYLSSMRFFNMFDDDPTVKMK